MRSRNVIITLLLVLALLVITVIKVRYWEPKKKLTFKRNPSRIEYSQLALCRMDCHHISANDITDVLRKGRINEAKTNKNEKPFPVFTIEGVTRKRMNLSIVVIQKGDVARIKTCYMTDGVFICNCPDDEKKAI